MHSLIVLLITMQVANAADERVMYFADPSKPGQHMPVGPRPVTSETGSLVSLELEIRTLSVEDQNRFARLVIDDYRYDEPTYFTDKRVPNVVFDVTTLDGNPAPFRVSSQGGGATLEYLHVHVAFEIGGDPEQLERETNRTYQEIAAKSLKPEDALIHLKTLKQKFAPNQPGTYRVRAIYRPDVPGKWQGELSTAPISIVITDAK